MTWLALKIVWLTCLVFVLEQVRRAPGLDDEP